MKNLYNILDEYWKNKIKQKKDYTYMENIDRLIREICALREISNEKDLNLPKELLTIMGVKKDKKGEFNVIIYGKRVKVF